MMVSWVDAKMDELVDVCMDQLSNRLFTSLREARQAWFFDGGGKGGWKRGRENEGYNILEDLLQLAER